MLRRFVAGALLGVSLFVGSLAWSGFLVLRTVLEPDRSSEIAEELLENEQVRSQLASNFVDVIFGAMLQNASVQQLDKAALESVANDLLQDPEVKALIISSLADTHAAFLGEGDAPQSLDLSSFGETARRSLVDIDPALDALLPVAPSLLVPLPTEHIPDASPVRSFLLKAIPLIAIGAAIGVLAAFFTTTDRPSILRRAGYWAISTAAFYLIAGFGIQWLFNRFSPNGTEVLAAFIVAVLRSTLIPAIVMGIVGVALLGASVLWASVTGGHGRSGRHVKVSKKASTTQRPRDHLFAAPRQIPSRITHVS